MYIINQIFKLEKSNQMFTESINLNKQIYANELIVTRPLLNH